jgi:hypothetical protein
VGTGEDGYEWEQKKVVYEWDQEKVVHERNQDKYE